MTKEQNPGGAKPTVLDWFGRAAASCILLGPLLGLSRAIPAEAAFRIYGIGGFGVLIAGSAFLVQAGRGRGFARGRPLVLAAGAVFIATVALAAKNAPMANDFATDLAAPPTFENALRLAPNHGRDMRHNPEDAALQREWYPDLSPTLLPMPPRKAFEVALDAARTMPRWKITWDDPGAGRIEAVATTRVFGFQDDIAIRVRPEGEHSILDVRSKSRDGKADLGANAARIRAYLEVVQSERS